MSLSRLASSLCAAGLLCIALPPSAHAEDASGWYAGIQGGWHQVRFQPDYTFPDGSRSQFDNRKAGVQWDVLFGHRTVINGRWAIGIEGGLGFNRTKWSLELPAEPAALEYTMPYEVRAAVLPERRLGDRAGLFASIGIGAGRVRELKTSPSSTRYDVERLRPLLVVGGGLRVSVSRRAQLRAEYRFRRMSRFEFDSVNPAGARVEHITDRPSSHAVSAGVTVGF